MFQLVRIGPAGRQTVIIQLRKSMILKEYLDKIKLRREVSVAGTVMKSGRLFQSRLLEDEEANKQIGYRHVCGLRQPVSSVR